MSARTVSTRGSKLPHSMSAICKYVLNGKQFLCPVISDDITSRRKGEDYSVITASEMAPESSANLKWSNGARGGGVEILSGRMAWTSTCANYPSYMLTASHPAGGHGCYDRWQSSHFTSDYYSSAESSAPGFILGGTDDGTC